MQKFLVAALVAMASVQSMAAGVCSKAAAEEKVNAICKDIEEKGEDAKNDWPDKLRYENCGDNYVWVQDTSADIKMVMHPIKPKKNGATLKDEVDSDGFRLFFEFDKRAKADKKGTAWVPYKWPKQTSEGKSTPKISFVKICKMKNGTSWIAGSGIWNEDLK